MAGALLTMTVGAHAYDLRSMLVSYFPFESSTTADAAGLNTFTGFPATNAPTLLSGVAPRGSAVQFNGTNQYLRIDHAQDNAATGFPIFRAARYSVAMWVKGAPQQGKSVFSVGSSTNNNPLLLLQTGPAGLTNRFSVLVRTDGGGTGGTLLNNVASTNVVFDSTWHHVAWVDDNGSVKLYVDGNLDPAVFNYTRAGTFLMDRTLVGALARATPVNFFNGAVDDLTVWERAISQSEVQQVMSNGIATPVPPLPPFIISQSMSVTKNHQDALHLAVTAGGTRPNLALSYQWYKNEAPVPDATNRTYSIFNLTTNNSGEIYKAIITSDAGGGSTTSTNIVLTVLGDGPVDLRKNIVSHWPFDSLTNNSGAYSTIDLYSRNDFNLTNMTEANLQSGQFGNSLLFDNLSTTHGVRSTGVPAYNTNGYSVSLWVKASMLDGGNAADVRVYSESSTNSNTPLFTIGAGALSATPAKIFIRSDANRELVNRSSARPVFDGAWHHLVWTDTNGNGKLYIDGTLDETDFTYVPSTLTLNRTSVGAVVRTNVSNMVFGNIDDVATWDRPISYTEVQEVKTSSIPVPLGATPPSFTLQPQGTNVFTKSDVTLSVLVSGTAPFTYQWFNGTSPLSGATNSVLILTNVQLSDAGPYKVSVQNSAATTNSDIATVNITTRPAPPTALAIDFNERNETAGYTQDGFQGFTLNGPVGSSTVPHSRLFGGVEVTVDGSGTTAIDSRRRVTPLNSGEFSEQLLLQDFVYSTATSNAVGLDVTVKFLQPNQLYTVTIWSFDSLNTGSRISDWYGNGVLLKDDYTFNGSVAPTNNQQYQFSFNVTSDADGTVTLAGRRDVNNPGAVGAVVFLNAFRIEIPVTRISSVAVVGGNVRVTVQTPDSSKTHTVEETTTLPTGWSTKSGTTTTVLSPTSLQIEFPKPTGATQFYRINRAE